MRVSSTSISGKQITLTYVEPGIWFGDVATTALAPVPWTGFAFGAETGMSALTFLGVAGFRFEEFEALDFFGFRAIVRFPSRGKFNQINIFYMIFLRGFRNPTAH